MCAWHGRYLANIAGETYSARTKYLLACGSTVIQATDPHYEFFQPLLQPGKHYIEVDANLTGFDERVRALASRLPEAERVGKDGQKWVKDCLRMVDVYMYMRSMLRVYASALTYQVTVTAYFSCNKANQACRHVYSRYCHIVVLCRPLFSVCVAIHTFIHLLSTY